VQSTVEPHAKESAQSTWQEAPPHVMAPLQELDSAQLISHWDASEQSMVPLHAANPQVTLHGMFGGQATAGQSFELGQLMTQVSP
jgi:hypothetical protein